MSARFLARVGLAIAGDTCRSIGDCWLQLGDLCSLAARGLR